jgi:hypothetical protein
MKKIMYCNVMLGVCLFVMSIVILRFYFTPVVRFSHLASTGSENIFYPLSSWLSLPSTGEVNAIGAVAWVIIMNRFLDMFLNKCGAVLESRKAVVSLHSD